MTNPPEQTGRPDVEKMKEAVAAFLKAAGQDPAQNPLLAQTPQLVAEAWASEFLDGCGKDPRALLARELLPFSKSLCASHLTGPDWTPVSIRNIRFTGVCPHHLLPWSGTAHVAYIPESYIVGYGAIAQEVEALAHHLVLQEVLAQQIACVFMDVVKPLAVLVRLEASQPCLTLRGERQHSAVTIAEGLVCRTNNWAERRLRKALEQ